MNTTSTTICLGLLAALFAVALMIGEGVGQEIHGYGEQQDVFLSSFLNTNGNLAVCGFHSIDGIQRNSRMWLAEIASDGQLLSSRVYDDFGGSTGRDLIQVEGGGYLIGGTGNHRERSRSFWAVRTSEEGEPIWAHAYNPADEAYDDNRCNDVIELKGGDFILAGTIRNTPDNGPNYSQSKGWIVRVSPAGETIWSMFYHGNEEDELLGGGWIYSILQCGEQIFGCGRVDGIGAWIFSVSVNTGELLWERLLDYNPEREESFYDKGRFNKIVSAPDGYYAFGSVNMDGEGGDQNRLLMTKFNTDGEVLNRRDLRLRFTEEFISENSGCYISSARTHPRGGFIVTLVGNFQQQGAVRTLAGVSRLDQFGNTMWEDTLQSAELLSISIFDEFEIGCVGEIGTNRPPNNAILYRISDHSPPFFRRGGHDAEEDFNREDSLDREQVGNGFEIRVLQGDVVRFWVDAHDRQDDQIAYEWTLDEEVVSDSTATTIAFDELGLFDVVCRITDDTTTVDSLWWRVNVVELYIRSHQPPETSLRLARGEAVDFSLDVRSIEGRELTYIWTHDSAFVSSEETFALEPLEDFNASRISGLVSNGNVADSVVWTAQLRSLFRSWVPEGNELSVPVGSTVRFEAVLEEGLPEGSLPYWIHAGDTLTWDTLAWEVTFDREGQTWVEMAVMIDRELIENVVWTVNVTPLGVVDLEIHPTRAGLLTATPNPFNSTVTLTYSVREASMPVKLAIRDITGREVYRFDLHQSIGANNVVWEATAFPAGIYFARLDVGGDVSTMKMVLVR